MTISIIALTISLMSLVVNYFMLNTNSKQLQANDAPRILTQKIKDNDKFREVHVMNLGNGGSIDVVCLMEDHEFGKRNKNYFLSKPSREILPGGSYTFYFRLDDGNMDRDYKTRIIFKDFFGKYYEAGYNLSQPHDDSIHLKTFAKSGKKLNAIQVFNVKKRMKKAIEQGNYYTFKQELAQKFNNLDTKQKKNRYNKPTK